MGLLASLLASLDNTTMTPAMEADDITVDVENEKDSVLGKGRSVRTTSANAMQRRNEDDVERTDDIFGLKGNNKKAETDNSDSEESSNTSSENQLTDTDDSVDDGGAENTDEAIDTLNTAEDTSDDTNQTDSFSKETLRDIMLTFYNLLTTNSSTLTATITNINEPESAAVVNTVISRLNDCKEIIFNEITDGMSKHSYAESLKVYIATKRVYELCVEMLSKHFDNITKPGEKKKPTQK